jgi:hypothetical protein
VPTIIVLKVGFLSVILSAIIWRKKATGQKWAKKYTVHSFMVFKTGQYIHGKIRWFPKIISGFLELKWLNIGPRSRSEKFQNWERFRERTSETFQQFKVCCDCCYNLRAFYPAVSELSLTRHCIKNSYKNFSWYFS